MLPAVNRHVLMMGVPWDIVFTKWFMCLFCTSLPSEVVLRVWDIFMVEGAEPGTKSVGAHQHTGVVTVLRFSIALLAMHEAEILAINADASQMYDLLDNMASEVYDIDRLLEATKRIDFRPGISPVSH